MIDFVSVCAGSSPGGTGGNRPPYPPYPSHGGANVGSSNPPYPVTNHSTYPPNTQSSFPSPASIPPTSQANLVTTEMSTTSSSNLNEDDIKASLRSAVEDKIKRRTRALFEQAQVIIKILVLSILVHYCLILLVVCAQQSMRRLFHLCSQSNIMKSCSTIFTLVNHLFRKLYS